MKWKSAVLAWIVFGATAIIALPLLNFRDRPLLEVKDVYLEVLDFPAHVTRAFGHYVASELFSGTLVFSSDANFGSPTRFDPSRLDEKLRSPHFLHFIAAGRLLVSEGWGKGIVSIDDPIGTGWMRVTGPRDDKLNAPHGVCQASDGWVYVADSLNSRLVRYRNDGKQWQVFRDLDRKIAYGRQLLCRRDGVWMSNSYESREGLNHGEGGNVLKIRDFAAGVVDVVATFPDTNLTGIEVIDERWLVVGLWGAYQSLVVVDLSDGTQHYVDNPPGLAGPPYGLHFDSQSKELIATWIGDIRKRTHRGGIVVYRVSP
ncbi:MAG: hypothetical protein DWQ08_08940 [Proteobacteria bacterium]|nr:MAG: hypothetical protein DWQ08_08940 [Pseudomonadota bacterium]